MTLQPYGRIKRACHFSYLSMSPIFCLPPILFLIFHTDYGISYTLLGTLILANFCTQLLIDLIFSFFSRHFNVRICVIIMPMLTTLGMTLYALAPLLFPDRIYLGLLLGTLVFSVSAGLSEVLLSPIISAIPGSTARDMSFLHSLFAIGAVLNVTLSSLFLHAFGKDAWQILTLLWAALPLISTVMFCISPMPPMELAPPNRRRTSQAQRRTLILCVLCIFLGSSAENVMTNWISGYMETALGVSKTLGDLLGMAVFAALLGTGRLLYTKFGGKILNVLLLGMAGSTACYLIAGISANVILSFLACITTGLCVSMLWPGSLILMEDHLPGAGVAAYALMSAGGDFGASVAPQLLGAVVDGVSASSWAGADPEQAGMRMGMLLAALFPLAGTVLLLYVRKYLHKNPGQ